MKVKLFFLILFAGFQVLAQDTLVNASESKTNPVIFTEVYFGGAGSDNGGLLLVGYNLNYQFRKNDLLTARFNGLLGLYQNFIVVSPLLVLPVSERKEIQKEFALLYGKRWTIDNYSLSASAGISYTDRDYYEKVGGYYEELNQNYFGVPFEINIKWFKPHKKKFRAYYGLIPIGKKKVSFGRSVGFKITGNLAKNNYVGLGFTYGFGWHKKY